MKVKDAVGRFGEDAACGYLQAGGFEILERNWRCPEGELDVVAIDRRGGDELVVVEVKTRSSAEFGSPAQAVGRAKAARLRRLAARWIEEHPESRGWSDVRIDVIAVVRQRVSTGAAGPEIDHFVGAVS